MFKLCLCQIFGEAPDLSLPLPPAPPSRSAPRRNKAICLSSGKRKARLYPPALCLADNDSESFWSLWFCFFLSQLLNSSHTMSKTPWRCVSRSVSLSCDLCPYLPQRWHIQQQPRDDTDGQPGVSVITLLRKERIVSHLSSVLSHRRS